MKIEFSIRLVVLLLNVVACKINCYQIALFIIEPTMQVGRHLTTTCYVLIAQVAHPRA